MTTLYYAPGACSLASHIVLEWIGAPYTAIRVKTGSEELKAVNPVGAVPALQEDDGWVLTQSGAVLEYLAARHPEARLGGAPGLRGQAELYRWSSFFTSDMHASFWPLFMPARYTTDDSEAALDAVRQASFAQIRKQLGVLDAHLAGREWILDGGRSVMDAYAFPLVRWAVNKLPGGLADFPHVDAHHQRLAADPQVRTVMADEGIG